MWNSCCNLSDDSFDYSGICICAASALENELFIHLFRNFQNYLDKKGIDWSEWPENLIHKKEKQYEKRDKFGIGDINQLFNNVSANPDSSKLLEQHLATIVDSKALGERQVNTFIECFTEPAEKA